jgi:hypothetical protein
MRDETEGTVLERIQSRYTVPLGVGETGGPSLRTVT